MTLTTTRPTSPQGRHLRQSTQSLLWEAMKSQLPRPKRPSWLRRPSRIGTQLGLASVTAVLMLATYSLPAYAADTPTEVTVAAGPEQQRLQMMSVDGAAAELPKLSRDTYSVTLPPPPPPVKKAAPAKPAPVKVSAARKVAAKGVSAQAAPGGGVIWPVGSGVRLSDGFGPRSSPCSGCSSDHKGLDMLPGAGTTIKSIADGTVAEVGSSGGGYGVYAIVRHVVNGQKVSSLYAHMQSGSLAVSEGQSVSKGQRLGRVGSTGASTGAHLHLEIRVNGTPVDPYQWLKAND